MNKTAGDGEFRIINPADQKRYKMTYAGLPENYVRFGNFLFYLARQGESVREIADKSVQYTRFYKAYRLQNAIREYNGIYYDRIERDTPLFIPYPQLPFLQVIEKSRKPKIIYTRGVYFTGNSIGDSGIEDTIARYKKVGINTVVFDAKDITGIVNYYSNVPDVLEFNTHQKRTIDDIDKLIRMLKTEGIHVIARIAVFQDHLMYKNNPSSAIHSARTGGTWYSGSEIWCDPTNKQVQDYNIELAIELCGKGVDEIQFDYVRFPTAGIQSDAVFAYSYGRMTREQSITDFLKRAYGEISKRNTLLSIDVFGVVAWSKDVDISKTGQRIESLSKYCDIISPMLYSSHFNDDFDGFANPGDQPYYFVYNGCRRNLALANGKVIRPWLQGFRWRVTNYNEDYIYKQIAACRDCGAYGYLFWNSKNDYRVVCSALEKLVLQKQKNEAVLQQDKPAAGTQDR
ncbi:MAG: putative glycoside hydrolase [Spirochaetes bacterium]|nr:putative glycoside hydrolase [Spirochaetota bacterium]